MTTQHPFVLPLVLAASILLQSAPTRANPSPPTEAISAAELGDAGPFQPVTFGSGIVFQDPAGLLSTSLRFRMQNRADFILDSKEEFRTEWQVRRARLRLNGHVLAPSLRYLLQLSFSRRDQDWDESGVPNVLRDAMILYDLTPQWQLGFGQGKLPGNRQRVVSSGDLQFIDRSIVNSAFNIDRDFGFQTQYRIGEGDAGTWILKGSLTSGEGRNRNVPGDRPGIYAARVEYLPFGKFERNGDYFESDLVFEQKVKWSIGAAFAFVAGSARANGTVGEIFTTSGERGDPVARRDQTVAFVDSVAKWQGHSLSIEYALRQSEEPLINDSQSLLNGQGINIQFGKMLTEKSELALRYSAILPEGQSRRDYDRRQEWAVVFNRFLNGHRVKLQGEIGQQPGLLQYGRIQMELGI